MHFPVLGSFYQRLMLLLPFASKSWNYDDANQWFVDFPQCVGYRQSPVSIHTHKAFTVSLPPILFGLYDVHLADILHVHNNGHTIEFEVPETILGEKPFITGGLLDEIYEAEAVHFHWGSPKKKGSEHMVNGRRYDVEMHIVHKNTKYVNTEMAREYEDGLAVLAVLFKVVKSPNVYYPGLNEIYDTLDDLVKYNSTTHTSHLISLGSLLANINREDFYTYRGSLTTPPCSEAVTWFVFPTVIPISYVELPKFWNVMDSKGNLLRNNFRPLQSIEYRHVYHRRPSTNYLF